LAAHNKLVQTVKKDPSTRIEVDLVIYGLRIVRNLSVIVDPSSSLRVETYRTVGIRFITARSVESWVDQLVGANFFLSKEVAIMGLDSLPVSFKVIVPG